MKLFEDTPWGLRTGHRRVAPPPQTTVRAVWEGVSGRREGRGDGGGWVGVGPGLRDMRGVPESRKQEATERLLLATGL
jgi:hypothetical protein